MLVYRLCRSKHKNDISGAGSIQYPGRWNLNGFQMLYTSETSSLAILETAVHYKAVSKIMQHTLLVIEIPDDHLSIDELGSDKLPDKWDVYPHIIETQEIGTKWLKKNQSLVLSVPSVVNPNERNFLINPLHPDFRNVTITGKRSYSIQNRLIHRLSFSG